MAVNEQSAAALIERISQALGPPTGQTTKLVAWSRGEFEVAVQIDSGPHVWLSKKWNPPGQPFRGLMIEQYAPGQERHSNLAANAPTLSQPYAARRIKDVTSNVDAVVRCVRACAVVAGEIPP